MDNQSEFTTFMNAYIKCMLFTEGDDNNTLFDENFSQSDFAPEAMDVIQQDCEKFFNDNEDIITNSQNLILLKTKQKAFTYAGYDFWFTRNGHGAGFWNGSWEHGDQLTEYCARNFPPLSLYVGDDGKLHLGAA